MTWKVGRVDRKEGGSMGRGNFKDGYDGTSWWT